MKFLHLIFLLLIFLILSCKKNELNKEKINKTTSDTLIIENQNDIRSIGEILSPKSKKKVENWSEYQQLDELLTNFYSISNNEALLSAKELSFITQQLKDSLKIDRFKQPDVSIRINVLHNSALRLADMSTISSISNNEVKEEIQNILDAFSALNAKINNIVSQEKLENELKTIENESINLNLSKK